MSRTFSFAVCVLLACKGSFGAGETDSQTGEGSTAVSESTGTPSPTSSPTTSEPTTGPENTTSASGVSATDGMTTSTTSTTTTLTTSTSTTTTGDMSTGTSEETASESSTGGPNGMCVPLLCGGKIYACGDCMDNDGDGKVDQADPECISPCDDREDTFATGLPGDNMDPCKQDCFFDGNSGGGAGDCAWNLKCDPLNPGGASCPYDPNFNNCPDVQPQQCLDDCQVPSGCDCFGCCTVSVDGMSYDIYLGDKTCSLAKIDSCQQCTKNDDCDDECHPEECEVCFGETEPPEGCEEPSCEGDAASCMIDDMGQSDCAVGFYCKTGCCHPLEPG